MSYDDPVLTANSYLNAPYVWGGSSRSGVDCSGLAKLAFPGLPRTAHEQYNATTRVNPNQLQRGDLVFWQGTQKGMGPGQASHVGIYDGAGSVIHASSSHNAVTTMPVSAWLKSSHYLGAGRVSGAAPSPPGATSMPLPQSRSVAPTGVLPTAGPRPSMLDIYRAIPQPAAPSLYNPAAPVQESYPLSSALDFKAAGMGDDVLTSLDGEQPSPNEQLYAAQKQALQTRPNPLAQMIAEYDAKAQQQKSLGDMLASMPALEAPHMDEVSALPWPQLNPPAIPVRAQPAYDPMSNILGTLAGLIDPQGAGAYAAAPMQAAIQQADQEYADRKAQFEAVSRQLAAEHQDELEARNDARHTAAANAGIRYGNATNDYEAQKAQRLQDMHRAELTTNAQSSQSLSDAFRNIGEQEQNAGLANLDVNRIGNDINTGLALNTAKNQQYKTQVEATDKTRKNLLDYQQHLNNNDTQASIAQGHDATSRYNVGVQSQTSTANSIRGSQTSQINTAATNASREKIAAQKANAPKLSQAEMDDPDIRAARADITARAKTRDNYGHQAISILAEVRGNKSDPAYVEAKRAADAANADVERANAALDALRQQKRQAAPAASPAPSAPAAKTGAKPAPTAASVLSKYGLK